MCFEGKVQRTEAGFTVEAQLHEIGTRAEVGLTLVARVVAAAIVDAAVPHSTAQLVSASGHCNGKSRIRTEIQLQNI